jgi:hypothetical protein
MTIKAKVNANWRTTTGTVQFSTEDGWRSEQALLATDGFVIGIMKNKILCNWVSLPGDIPAQIIRLIHNSDSHFYMRDSAEDTLCRIPIKELQRVYRVLGIL